MTAHVYWRLNVTAGNNANILAITEMSFTDIHGAVISTSSSTFVASVGSGLGAFDGDQNTAWAEGNPLVLPAWLSIQFPTAQTIGNILISRGLEYQWGTNTSPNTFTIEYSDDGTTWVTAITQTGVTAWTDNIPNVYNINPMHYTYVASGSSQSVLNAGFKASIATIQSQYSLSANTKQIGSGSTTYKLNSNTKLIGNSSAAYALNAYRESTATGKFQYSLAGWGTKSAQSSSQYKLQLYKTLSAKGSTQYVFNTYKTLSAKGSTQYVFNTYKTLSAKGSAQYVFNTYKTLSAKGSTKYKINAYTQYQVHASAQWLLDAGSVFYGIQVNLQTGAVSKLEGLTYNSLSGQMGADSTGIHLMQGTTDNGLAIDAFVESGYLKFADDHHTRVTDAYLGMVGGALQLTVSDERTGANNYTFIPTTQMMTSKSKLGRGASGKYWSVMLSNVLGSSASVDSIRLLTDKLSRRI